MTGLKTALICLAFLPLACAPRSPKQPGANPANIQTYAKPPALVWKTVTDTVRYDFLMPLEVADEKRGYFSTELVRDYQPYLKTKYRLSGTISYDGQLTLVKLYRHLQVEQDGRWRAVPSDLFLEGKILSVVSKKLEPRN